MRKVSLIAAAAFVRRRGAISPRPLRPKRTQACKEQKSQDECKAVQGC